MKLRFTPRAAQDLAAIADYIRAQSGRCSASARGYSPLAPKSSFAFDDIAERFEKLRGFRLLPICRTKNITLAL